MAGGSEPSSGGASGWTGTGLGPWPKVMKLWNLSALLSKILVHHGTSCNIISIQNHHDPSCLSQMFLNLNIRVIRILAGVLGPYGHRNRGSRNLLISSAELNS